MSSAAALTSALSDLAQYAALGFGVVGLTFIFIAAVAGCMAPKVRR